MSSSKGRIVKRLIPLVLVASISPLLTACLPMMAVSAASMAAQSAGGGKASNAEWQPEARDACAAEAAKYGSVQVNVVEQHKVDQIIVWGLVDDGKETRSFQCDFGTKITGFTLRQIEPAH